MWIKHLNLIHIWNILFTNPNPSLYFKMKKLYTFSWNETKRIPSFHNCKSWSMRSKSWCMRSKSWSVDSKASACSGSYVQLPSISFFSWIFIVILHPYLISSRIKSRTWTNQSKKMMTPKLAIFPYKMKEKRVSLNFFIIFFSDQTP